MKKLLLILMFSVFCVNVYAFQEIDEWQKQCIQDRVQLELNLNPAYVWGAADLAPGAPGDCSGKMRAICKSCGLEVSRTTSLRMAKGLDGWDFPSVDYKDIKPLALYFMTLKKNRPDGHVGMIISVYRRGEKLPTVTLVHASSSMGFVEHGIPPENSDWAFRGFSGARQMDWK